MVQSIGNEQNKDNPLMPKGDNVNLEQGHSSRQDSRYKPMTTSGLEPEDEPIRKKGLGDINWTSFLINIVIALVVVMMMNSFFMPVVGKKTYQADITRLENDLVAMRETDVGLSDKIKTLESSLAGKTNELTEIANAIRTEVNDKIKEIDNRIDSLNGILTNYATVGSVGQNTADIATLRSNLGIIEGKVNGIDLSTINTNLTNILQTTIPGIQQDIIDLEEAIEGLEQGDTAVAPTTGEVLAAVSNWTGNSALSFTAVPANSTQTQFLTFQVNNGTGQVINNLQLGIGLQLRRNNDVIATGLGTGVTVTLSSIGGITIWNPQNTGYNYLLGFTNAVTTGVFSGIGAISQNPGTATYQLAVTVTNLGGTDIEAFTMYPMVQVISYQ